MKSNHKIRTLQALPGRSVWINGVEWLHFSGTNYLGIAQDADFKRLVKAGIDQYGVHFGGSRLSNLRIDIYEMAEHLLSGMAKLDDALTVTSGTLAGRIILNVFGENYLKCHAPGAHPAIKANQQKSEFYDQWLTNLLEISKDHPGQEIVLLVNSIDPLKAQKTDLSWIDQLPDQERIYLVIDDSHGFGLTGKDGGGINTELDLPDHIEPIIISSLGKAFGIPGGVIMGPEHIIEQVWRDPLFGGSSPVSPAYLKAFVEGQPLYQHLRQKLSLVTQAFSKQIATLSKFQFIPDFPVFFTPDNQLGPYLANHEIMISSFPYPTPEDDLITRVILNGQHQMQDIEVLFKCIKSYFKGAID